MPVTATMVKPEKGKLQVCNGTGCSDRYISGLYETYDYATGKKSPIDDWLKTNVVGDGSGKMASFFGPTPADKGGLHFTWAIASDHQGDAKRALEAAGFKPVASWLSCHGGYYMTMYCYWSKAAGEPIIGERKKEERQAVQPKTLVPIKHGGMCGLCGQQMYHSRTCAVARRKG